MKNLDTLMAEDRDGTVRLLMSLHYFKMKTFKRYLHTLLTFVIAAILLTVLCEELKFSIAFVVGLLIFIAIGSYLTYRAHTDAHSYKLLIEKYK